MNDKPARWVVVPPDGTRRGFDDPNECKEYAERKASENPGQYVHIYQHLTALRSTVTAENDDAD